LPKCQSRSVGMANLGNRVPYGLQYKLVWDLAPGQYRIGVAIRAWVFQRSVWSTVHPKLRIQVQANSPSELHDVTLSNFGTCCKGPSINFDSIGTVQSSEDLTAASIVGHEDGRIAWCATHDWRDGVISSSKHERSR
jgi:hypothetical protein